MKREGVVGQNQNAPSITDAALQFWNVPLNSGKVTLPNKTTRFGMYYRFEEVCTKIFLLRFGNVCGMRFLQKKLTKSGQK